VGIESEGAWCYVGAGKRQCAKAESASVPRGGKPSSPFACVLMSTPRGISLDVFTRKKKRMQCFSIHCMVLQIATKKFTATIS